MKINRLSGRERGQENLAKVRSYLAGLKAASQSLPLEDGRPNITAIAEANAGVKRLLAEFAGGSVGSAEPTAGLARAERQLEVKDRRILQLEQQLASVKAENEELRKRLAAGEQRLTRYKLIEEDVLKAGRRVIP